MLTDEAQRASQMVNVLAFLRSAHDPESPLCEAWQLFPQIAALAMPKVPHPRSSSAQSVVAARPPYSTHRSGEATEPLRGARARKPSPKHRPSGRSPRRRRGNRQPADRCWRQRGHTKGPNHPCGVCLIACLSRGTARSCGRYSGGSTLWPSSWWQQAPTCTSETKRCAVRVRSLPPEHVQFGHTARGLAALSRFGVPACLQHQPTLPDAAARTAFEQEMCNLVTNPIAMSVHPTKKTGKHRRKGHKHH